VAKAHPMLTAIGWRYQTRPSYPSKDGYPSESRRIPVLLTDNLPKPKRCECYQCAST
jgi:hypothetical protein